MLRVLRLVCVVVLACMTSNCLQAGILYNEATDGELSPDNTAPTALGPAMAGANTVTGRVIAIGNDGTNNTADIFSFVIPTGLQLDSIFLTNFTSSSSAMFLAVDDDAVFQFSAEEINHPTNSPDLTQVLGAVLVGNNHIGTDILARLADPLLNNNGIPFSRPLGSGTYSVYIQETGSFSNYSLQFNVSAVPEPSTAGLVGMLLLGAARRRTRKITT